MGKEKKRMGITRGQNAHLFDNLLATFFCILRARFEEENSVFSEISKIKNVQNIFRKYF